MRRLPKIKPCPFCGNKDEVSVAEEYFFNRNSNEHTSLYFVCCGECGAWGSKLKSERAAIRRWNACNKRKETK